MDPKVPVDAHVHLHPQVETSALLAAAAANLAAHAGDPGTGVLMLAEMPGEGAFARLSEEAGLPPGWTVRRTDDDGAVLLKSDSCITLVIMAGHQITTREGLEVLGLGTTTRFRQGRDLGDTVAEVRDVGALAVLPWGFGKWWGERGRVLQGFLDHDAGPLCLGDNGGRPAFGPPPPAFEVARQRGMPVLPGSDPLPVPGGHARVGSYGFLAAGLDSMQPVRSLKRHVHALAGGMPPTFGRRAHLITFCRNQLTMQLSKRRAA